MNDDVRELIEPADEWDTRAVQRNPEKAAAYIRALAAALEADTVTGPRGPSSPDSERSTD